MSELRILVVFVGGLLASLAVALMMSPVVFLAVVFSGLSNVSVLNINFQSGLPLWLACVQGTLLLGVTFTGLRLISLALLMTKLRVPFSLVFEAVYRQKIKEKTLWQLSHEEMVDLVVENYRLGM